jgi:hypothetical protein
MLMFLSAASADYVYGGPFLCKTQTAFYGPSGTQGY